MRYHPHNHTSTSWSTTSPFTTKLLSVLLMKATITTQQPRCCFYLSYFSVFIFPLNSFLYNVPFTIIFCRCSNNPLYWWVQYQWWFIDHFLLHTARETCKLVVSRRTPNSTSSWISDYWNEGFCVYHDEDIQKNALIVLSLFGNPIKMMEPLRTTYLSGKHFEFVWKLT